MFDLEQAATALMAAAPAAPGGQTYALLIGVSKYQRPDLSLQFAHADAQTFSQMLGSPRGGGIPAQNIITLTDDKATTAAVRNAFQDFMKRRATKNDTVIIFVAGHGTVETPGSRNAFILTPIPRTSRVPHFRWPNSRRSLRSRRRRSGACCCSSTSVRRARSDRFRTTR
jgi:hypothetical protein